MTVQILTSLPKFIERDVTTSNHPNHEVEGQESSMNQREAMSENPVIFSRDFSSNLGGNHEETNYLRCKVDQVNLIFSPDLPTGHVPLTGTLFVSESALYFQETSEQGMTVVDADAGRGSAGNTVYVIDYPSILIHAIARGSEDQDSSQNEHEVPKTMIYCQLDSFGSKLDANGDEIEDDMSTGDDFDSLFEMKIVPKDISQIDTIFQAMSECAALHPDKFMEGEEGDDQDRMYTAEDFQDTLDDVDENNRWFCSPEDVNELNQVGQAALAHLETVFDIPSGQTFTFKEVTRNNENSDHSSQNELVNQSVDQNHEDERFEDAD